MTIALLLMAGPAIQAGSPARETGSPWKPLPAEIARVLERKAEAYRQRARGFSCTERIRRTRYGNEGAGKEKADDYDYLLVEDRAAPGGFRGLRTRPGSSGRRERRVDLPFPDPYLWSQIFSPAVRSTLRFQVGQWHTTPWKLAIPLDWDLLGTEPFRPAHHRMVGYGGSRVQDGQPLENRGPTQLPGRPDPRRTRPLPHRVPDPRVLGRPPPPEGLELEVLFGFEHEGQTYPTRVELRTFRQVHRGERRITSRRVVEYRDYRFFGTRVQVEVPPFTYLPPTPGDE
ncbi:MAG: hypothetical protein Q9Q13_12180 [Acidobacteriota bacterium]|nr:hypothetical protein [Acidobacteriota bacterium]